ncbi:MAG TPA: BON domain-containing protein [Chitinispirillaceae bacterium]|nr:BON domain-containing protein [Chitinispirillaceae bacterium]
MALSKEEIKKNIVDQLFWDARVDASTISIDFVDGTVCLNGTAATFLARQAAEEDVWAIAGITSVQNNIAVKKPYAYKLPSDSEIKNMLTSILQWDPDIDSGDILINVENGNIILDGSVPAFWQKVRVEELATEIDGVIHLHNRLTVVPSAHYVDELIARDVVAAIDRSADTNINNINVQVNDGRVILSGSVSNFRVKKSAEDCARYTDGVIDVINNLVII